MIYEYCDDRDEAPVPYDWNEGFYCQCFARQMDFYARLMFHFSWPKVVNPFACPFCGKFNCGTLPF